MFAPGARDRPSQGPDGFELEADLIRTLANAKRLRIVAFLGHGPRTVSEIADHLGLSLQNTSQHLRLLRDRGIAQAHRNGREVFYALTSPVISEACAVVRETLTAVLPGTVGDTKHREALPERAGRFPSPMNSARTRSPVLIRS